MDAIIFFDIRNFSAHREFLARSRAARPLSSLVKALLEEASSLSKSLTLSHGMTKMPLLNHTGDGFVLVLRECGSSIAAVRFASVFRETAEQLLGAYQKTFLSTRISKEQTLPSPLGYGMGLHSGKITVFKYQSIGGERSAFLGSAVNIASRVEGCSKDHPHPVLCTKTLVIRATDELGKRATLGFQKYFVSLGLHNLRGLERPIELVRCEPRLHCYLVKHGFQ
jgi:class 3 adenylate cyclase